LAKRLCVRRARAKDRRSILQCLRAAFAPFESTYTAEAFLDTVLTQATLTERMAAMSVWVAVDEADKVIGTLACGTIGDREGHLRGMAVAPSWQGRRVADELLWATEEELQRSGCSLVTLDTTAPLERARRFYEKHGFRPTGKVTDLFGMPLTEHAKVLIRGRGRARTQRGRKSASCSVSPRRPR
jgi:ribosomal protein S18 acetylase RimI-like enzyme